MITGRGQPGRAAGDHPRRRQQRRGGPRRRPSSRPVEHYRIGQNVKAYVLEVRRSSRGPQILVSRTHKGFLKRLFELEVPEIHSGTVEIKAIAREPGSRSKVAVASRQEGLDPVGATVGQRGARVQAVVAELGGEKIDIIPWNDDASVFVANALSPGPGDQRRHRRGEADRQRDGPRADAVAGDRPRGPERPARRPADGLADRHPERRLGRRGQGRRGRGRARPSADAAAPRRPPRPSAGRAAGDGAVGRGGADGAPRPPATKRRAKKAAEPTADAARSRRRREDGRRAAKAAGEPKPPTRRPRPPRSRPPTADGRRPRTPTPRRRRSRRRSRRAKKAADRGGGVVGAAERATRSDAPRRVPTRSCVACRTAAPKRDLVRIVRTPDGADDDR